MRNSFEPTYRKYVQGYGFLSFARNFGEYLNTSTKLGTIKYGKKNN